MPPMINPFVPTFGVSPPLLVGRDKVIMRLERALHHGPTHPDYTLLLTGPRGSGKTVMLNSAEAVARKIGWSVVSVSASSDTFRGELLAMLAGIIPDGGSKLHLASVQVSGVGGSVERHHPQPASLPPLVRTALSGAADRMAEQDAGLLVTIDELQAGDPAEMREFATALQHVTRRELRPVAFVGAALPNVEETLLVDPGMTFFQRCARARLEPLSPAEAGLAIERPIRDNGGWIEADALDLAVQSAGGYPFMVQLVGFHTWDICENLVAGITRNHVKAGVVEASAVLIDQIVRPVWNVLSAVDRAFLVAMSRDDGSSYVGDIARRLGKDGNYVNYYRGRLLKAGAVSTAGRGRLHFAHHVMRDWLREHPYQETYELP